MTTARIIVEDCVGELRAAALTQDGQPAALFLDRWDERGDRARWGDRIEARVSGIDRAQGGAFLELSNGEPAFAQNKHARSLTEGQRLDVVIDAEARSEKAARVRPAPAKHDDSAPFDRWRASLPGGAEAVLEPVKGPSDIVAAAFDAALSRYAPLPGGGRLSIVATPALVAIDVDASGRHDKGRAADRALAVNLDAASEAARQVALRSLGGLVVLDCIAPILRHHAAPLKDAFKSALVAADARRADVLAPSPFGLLQAAIPWRWRPIADAPPASALAALKDLEREARARPAERLRLALPAAWRFDALDRRIGARTALSERYGERLSIIDAAIETHEIGPHD